MSRPLISERPSRAALDALATRLVAVSDCPHDLKADATAHPVTIVTSDAHRGAFLLTSCTTLNEFAATNGSLTARAVLVTTAALTADERLSLGEAARLVARAVLFVRRVPTRLPYACFEVEAHGLRAFARMRAYVHEAPCFGGFADADEACPLFTGARATLTGGRMPIAGYDEEVQA